MTSPTIAIPSLTMEEEGHHIVLARITNDERPLKRVIKKFHNYIYAASADSTKTPASSDGSSETSADDAKESFLVELASFQLLLKKSVMTCEAEGRQVEEYQKEREKIEQEHDSLKTQIKDLKVALEHAQILRRRKMEYDVVAEKIHGLPSRDELEQEIAALENDMAAIRSENEVQEKTIQGHKSALNGIVAELASLRLLGRDKDTVSEVPSTRASPAPDGAPGIGIDAHTDASTGANMDTPTPSAREDADEEKLPTESDSQNAIETLNDDIEMGELEEDPKEKEAAAKKKQVVEELEEGETFDGSSELSEPPDDSDDEL
ncbi:hypothetical protein AGABI1DRAFT_128074 [Agaricus bisporus var. burnettii JB137-S8]|uniref:THO complex subunit 7 n=1 Tax=Agaricus bisporus var. burnettii (strain JB137-S8 / ATCC MYA-4627 / FGSC 10392) TaxID=597362 RepID=K5XYF7_AGABU|nr:uncharacterized protein AGABI1DRAFT_128074 [Agaricus bisporus var. burnettii JB137-S8]EKM80400.1 hypothetical protein AGABI1DRAFT_128074 [Agaricus bisporus var. burnettii JB137-S8]